MYDGEKVLPREGCFGLSLRKCVWAFAEQWFDICAGRDKLLDEER